MVSANAVPLNLHSSAKKVNPRPDIFRRFRHNLPLISARLRETLNSGVNTWNASHSWARCTTTGCRWASPPPSREILPPTTVFPFWARRTLTAPRGKTETALTRIGGRSWISRMTVCFSERGRFPGPYIARSFRRTRLRCLSKCPRSMNSASTYWSKSGTEQE